MADNIKVAPGIGAGDPPVATDDIGGIHYQKIKNGWGADGTWNEVDDVVGKRMPIADPVNVPASAFDGGSGGAGNSGQAVSAATGLRLIGLSVRETTGTGTALFYLRHGTTVAASPLVIISLGPGESVREWYGADGIAAASGIYTERNAGSTQYVVYYKVVP